MASVSFTKIASGTLNPPSASGYFTWNNYPAHDRVHSFWLSIEPMGGGAAYAEGWITKSSQKVFANPFNRQMRVWFQSESNVVATFDLYMANVAP